VEIKNKSKTDFCPCKVGVGAKERREKEGRILVEGTTQK